MESLLNVSTKAVRDQWHMYDDATRSFVFDIVWDNRANALKTAFPECERILHELRDFCGDPARAQMVKGSLTSKQRAQWHQICEELGLNHTSTGPQKKRALTIIKLPKWRWEFTDRPPQKKPQRKRPPRDLQKEREQEDVAEACFQVYYKFSAHGYDSPEDMLEHEPEYRELVKKARR